MLLEVAGAGAADSEEAGRFMRIWCWHTSIALRISFAHARAFCNFSGSAAAARPCNLQKCSARRMNRNDDSCAPARACACARRKCASALDGSSAMTRRQARAAARGAARPCICRRQDAMLSKHATRALRTSFGSRDDATYADEAPTSCESLSRHVSVASNLRAALNR